jgi:hypothetical protein
MHSRFKSIAQGKELLVEYIMAVVKRQGDEGKDRHELRRDDIWRSEI